MSEQDHLADNIRAIREARGLSQQQIAKAAGIPRATWTHLESGGANPTLAVLIKVAAALQIRPDELPARQRGPVAIRKLLPEPLPGLDLERMTLPPNARMAGVPHTPGTREYLTCEHGTVELSVAGERFTLTAGDVAIFRGDQRHAYHNPGTVPAVAYSAIAFAPAGLLP